MVSVSDSQIDFDKTAKLCLKQKARFKSFLKFALSAEKFNALDFNRFEFIGTEMIQKKIGGIFQECRADVIAQIGLKGMNTKTLVGVIVEHKSSISSQKQFYLQVLKYNVALLEAKIYPVMTVVLLHGKAPFNMATNLQSAFDWTSEMKRVFGPSGLNFGLDVVDLNRKSEQDIREEAGAIVALCYAFKFAPNMTKDAIKSVLELCYNSSKGSILYNEYGGILGEYLLQVTDYSRKVLSDIESGIISKKEGLVMPSTAFKLRQEGLQEGLQKGLQKGRQEGRQEVALKLIEKNMTIQEVCEITGLSEEEVHKICK